jgi:hypothetical protein
MPGRGQWGLQLVWRTELVHYTTLDYVEPLSLISKVLATSLTS